MPITAAIQVFIERRLLDKGISQPEWAPLNGAGIGLHHIRFPRGFTHSLYKPHVALLVNLDKTLGQSAQASNRDFHRSHRPRSALMQDFV